MDLRTKKTQRAIREAFLTLRAKKPLERITVKELAELAEISKATFYLHYQDIYDLSDQMQRDVIQDTMEQLTRPDAFLQDPMQFMREFVQAFYDRRAVTQVLFSGVQAYQFPAYIEESFRQYYAQHFPHLEQDSQFQAFLTYQVYGSYFAFLNNVDRFGRRPVLEALHDLSQALTASSAYRQAVESCQ